MNFISHRGNDCHSYPENSISALLWCLDQDYIDGVEIDIRMTKDQKLVLSHDASILELGFRRYFVKDETLNTLQKVNLGTKKNPHYLDSLEQFLSQVQSQKMIVLDIKQELGSMDLFLKVLRKVLKKYSYLNLYIVSFRYDIVKLCTTTCKKPVGLLVSDFINKKKDYNPFNFLSVSKGAYSDISSHKKKMVWTINQKRDLKKFHQDIYVITDKAYDLAVE